MTHAENMRKNSPAEKVHLRREGKIAILELDNPDGGYLTAYMVQEIDRLTMALEADPAVRVIVLTGRIPGTFITHYSPRELTGIASVVNDCSSDAEVARLRRQTAFLTRWIYRFSRFPRLFGWLEGRSRGTSLEALFLGARFNLMQTRWQHSGTVFIAALNGYAMGGGCEMALACDFRLMARGEGLIGLPEAISGIIPGAGGTQRLARLLGAGRAIELILAGAFFHADEAERIGLVSRAVDADQLMDETMALAAQMAGQPPLAIHGVKCAVRKGVDLPLECGIAEEAVQFMSAVVSRDAAALGGRYLELRAEGSTAAEAFAQFRKGGAVELRGN